MTTDNQDAFNKAIAAMEARRDLYLAKAASIEDAIVNVKNVFSTEFLNDPGSTIPEEKKKVPADIVPPKPVKTSVPSPQATTENNPVYDTPDSYTKDVPEAEDLQNTPFGKYAIKTDDRANQPEHQKVIVKSKEDSSHETPQNKAHTYIQENIIKGLQEKAKSMSVSEITKLLYSNKVRSLWSKEKKKDVEEMVTQVLESGTGTHWTKLGTKYTLLG